MITKIYFGISFGARASFLDSSFSVHSNVAKESLQTLLRKAIYLSRLYPCAMLLKNKILKTNTDLEEAEHNDNKLYFYHTLLYK